MEKHFLTFYPLEDGGLEAAAESCRRLASDSSYFSDRSRSGKIAVKVKAMAAEKNQAAEKTDAAAVDTAEGKSGRKKKRRLIKNIIAAAIGLSVGFGGYTGVNYYLGQTAYSRSEYSTAYKYYRRVGYIHNATIRKTVCLTMMRRDLHYTELDGDTRKSARGVYLSKSASSISEYLYLHNDGTIGYTGKDEELKNELSKWTDMLTVSAGNNHVVGFRADGTVKAAGYNSLGQCDVSGYKNVKAVSVGDNCTHLLLENGDLITKGYQYCDCNMNNWPDIKNVVK